MICVKCGYREKKGVKRFGESLCQVCCVFAPEDEKKFEKYISDKTDWKAIDSFRRSGQMPGMRQKRGMSEKAKKGEIVTRSPMGYNVKEGKLVQNEDSAKIHSLFKTFLRKDYSLNSLSKNYGLSVNGLKKVLKNRTYLGEIKFDGRLHKASHKAIISPEIFYAVQRKLETYLRPRKSEANKYVLKGEKEPLKVEGDDKMIPAREKILKKGRSKEEEAHRDDNATGSEKDGEFDKDNSNEAEENTVRNVRTKGNEDKNHKSHGLYKSVFDR
jgi:hypothetical protein